MFKHSQQASNHETERSNYLMNCDLNDPYVSNYLDTLNRKTEWMQKQEEAMQQSKMSQSGVCWNLVKLKKFDDFNKLEGHSDFQTTAHERSFSQIRMPKSNKK